MSDTRHLRELCGVGKAALQDLRRLGITSVDQLAGCEAQELYGRLGALDGQLHDICVHDTFACAIAQARDPLLPPEQCRWWWWSRQRKAADTPSFRKS